jgi:hypothetical protein
MHEVTNIQNMYLHSFLGTTVVQEVYIPDMNKEINCSRDTINQR